MRFLTTLIMLCATISAFASAAPEQQEKINSRIQQLRQVLLTRGSPDSMLVPSVDEQSRVDQSRSVMRPYISLQFEYSMADLRWKGEDVAELPVRVRWETAKVDGSLSGTMNLVRVGGEWYFRSFDFLQFPWAEVILAALVAVAFTVGMFWLARKLKNRRKAAPASA